MKKLEIYNGNKNYIFPTGKIATPQVMIDNYPAVEVLPHVIETDEGGQIIYALNPLSAMRSRYNIDATLSNEEAVIELENIINAPEPIQEYEPSAEERIASALEFQNLMSMNDAEGGM